MVQVLLLAGRVELTGLTMLEVLLMAERVELTGLTMLEVLLLKQDVSGWKTQVEEGGTV